MESKKITKEIITTEKLRPLWKTCSEKAGIKNYKDSKSKKKKVIATQLENELQTSPRKSWNQMQYKILLYEALFLSPA